MATAQKDSGSRFREDAAGNDSRSRIIMVRMAASTPPAQARAFIQDELDSAALYDTLAAAETRHAAGRGLPQTGGHRAASRRPLDRQTPSRRHHRAAASSRLADARVVLDGPPVRLGVGRLDHREPGAGRRRALRRHARSGRRAWTPTSAATRARCARSPATAAPKGRSSRASKDVIARPPATPCAPPCSAPTTDWCRT